MQTEEKEESKTEHKNSCQITKEEEKKKKKQSNQEIINKMH